MTPLASILIPAYNAERTIADTVQSALAQTWPRKEVIIVDDDSRDQTLSIARTFASRDVSVVTKCNAGAAAARNHAFGLSQGDYIQWLDADDLLAPDKILKQMEQLEDGGSSRTAFSSAWGRFTHRISRARFVPTLLWQNLSAAEWLFRKITHNLFMQTATWLVSRDLTEAAGPWDTRLLSDDDGEYFSRVLLHSDGIRFVPEARVFYRRSGSQSLSYVGSSEKKLEAHLLSVLLHIKYLRSLEESERVRSASLDYLQRSLIYFYPEHPNLVASCQELAAELGGRLEPPKLSWKYGWMQWLFGWTATKRAQLAYNKYKASMLGSWDSLLCRLKI